MKFASVITAALLPLAFAAPTATTPSGEKVVVADIKHIVSNVTALDGVVDQAKGGEAYSFDQLVTILNYSNTLASGVHNLTAAVNASKKFDASDSKSISNAGKPLQTDTLKLLSDFNSHYDSFNASGVTSSVLSSLVSQREASRELINSLAAKLASAQAATAKKDGVALASAYNKAIATYNQTSS